MKLTDVAEHKCDLPDALRLPREVAGAKWGPCPECGAKWEYLPWGAAYAPNLRWRRVRRSSRAWRRAEKRRVRRLLEGGE